MTNPNDFYPWNKAKDFVYPMLVPEAFLLAVVLEEARHPDQADLLPTCLLPWLGGIYVSHVLEISGKALHVSKTMLRAWEVTEEDLSVQARSNLAKRPAEWAKGQTPAGRRWAIVQPDLYAGARVILDEMLEEFSHVVGPSFTVHPIARNILYAVESNLAFITDPQPLSEIQEVINIHCDVTMPLPRGFLTVNQGKRTPRWFSTEEDIEKGSDSDLWMAEQTVIY